MKKHPKAQEVLEYLAKRGKSLTFYCDKGEQVSRNGRCTCNCDNSVQKEARKVKFNKLKEYGLFHEKSYKVVT